MARDIVERLRRSPERARLCEDAADAIEQRDAEIERLRTMFDTTRHRVLRALGVGDMGKSWAWIEAHLGERQATADTEPPACTFAEPDPADPPFKRATEPRPDPEAWLPPEHRSWAFDYVACGQSPPSNPSAAMFTDRTDEHDARRDAEKAGKRCGNCGDKLRCAWHPRGTCDDWQPVERRCDDCKHQGDSGCGRKGSEPCDDWQPAAPVPDAEGE